MIVETIAGTFDEERRDDLQKAYSEADGDTFEFEGTVLVKDFAKYILEYLDSELKSEYCAWCGRLLNKEGICQNLNCGE